VGTNVQAYDADLTTYAGITPSANIQSLLGAATYAAMRTQLDLEAGTDFYSITAADTAFEGELNNSAGLRAALSDETGTGSAVFSTSPTFTGTTILANATTTNLEITGALYDGTGSKGTNGYVLQTTGTGTEWVATSSLNISGGGGASAFVDLTDVSIVSLTGNRVPFTNAGGTAITDSGDFSFNDTSDVLTVGGLTLSDGLVAFTSAATTTILNNSPFAFTIATSTSGNPLFRIDTTTGAEQVIIGGGGSSDVVIGAVGQVTNLVFEENTVIHGQGENLLTFGQAGDTINFGVNVGIGSSTPSRALTVDGGIYLASTTPSGTSSTLYNLGGTLYFNGIEVGTGGGGLWNELGADIYFDTGDVAIGTSTASKRLTVWDTVADAQFSLAYDGTRYGNFQIDSVGDLLMTASGDDIYFTDDNLWVCEAGSCPAITASSTAGYAIVENGMYFGNGMKIDQISGTTTELGIYDTSGAVILIFD